MPAHFHSGCTAAAENSIGFREAGENLKVFEKFNREKRNFCRI